MPRGRPLAAKMRAQVRAESLFGAGVFACAGGALAAPAPPALLSRFLQKEARILSEVCNDDDGPSGRVFG